MPGFSTITGDESIVWADNLSFDGTERGGKLTTDGELLIGSTVAPHIRKGTLQAGSGIGIANASGSITISSTAVSFTWNDATNATYSLNVQNCYITNRGGGVTFTLPATAVLGDTIKIVGKTGLATIAQNANQQIFIGNTNTTLGVGGSLVATNAGDCVSIVCITAGASTAFRVDSVIGNWTVN